MASDFHLFRTAIGSCGIAWGPRGIAAVQLPETSDPILRQRLRQRCDAAHETRPTAVVARVIADIQALLAGSRPDFADAPLDLAAASEFERRVYAQRRTIACGTTLTYGELAERLGDPLQARAVGQALGRNPLPLLIPCHRVLAAGGELGGFSAHGGVVTKRRLLEIEGAIAQLSLPL